MCSTTSAPNGSMSCTSVLRLSVGVGGRSGSETGWALLSGVPKASVAPSNRVPSFFSMGFLVVVSLYG